MHISYQGRPRQATFIERQNRFVARVEVDGEESLAHVPSSGRMAELLYPGAQVFVLRRAAGQRKTAFDLILARREGGLVSVDSRLPNLLVHRSLQDGGLPPFTGLLAIKQEYSYGSSRVDFRLEQEGKPCLLEVKSVTLVKEGRALFPDAPTGRGTRHLEELVHARGEGYRAAVLFVIQREDSLAFSPHGAADADFAAGLARAARAGVEIYAYDCTVDLIGVSLRREVPVIL